MNDNRTDRERVRLALEQLDRFSFEAPRNDQAACIHTARALLAADLDEVVQALGHVDAYAVPCPSCGSPLGQLCRRPPTNPSLRHFGFGLVHRGRLEAALVD